MMLELQWVLNGHLLKLALDINWAGIRHLFKKNVGQYVNHAANE